MISHVGMPRRNKMRWLLKDKPWAEWRHGNKRRFISKMKVKIRKQQRAKSKVALQQEKGNEVEF